MGDKMKLSQTAKNALQLGALCAIAYFVVYIARNVLGAVTPQMIAIGYTEEYIGSISSLFFVFYAFGQLINGAIGDKIRAKWMICIGLLGAGLMNLLFSHFIHLPQAATITYAMTGYFLSMIYGPMTKVVAENTEPVHAARCSVAYNFSSFFGSPVAGLLAAFFFWQSAIDISSGALIVMAIAGFVCFTAFEKRGAVRYDRYKAAAKGARNVKILFRYHIVKFSFISILTGVVRTSVVFWLPTYIAQYLDFSSKAAAGIFTAASFIISFTALIAVMIYDKLGRDMNKTNLVMFAAAAVFFALTYFVHQPVLNIVFIVLAIMSSNGVASMLWSIYCPSLRDTGMVSSATGFLDFLSYMAAAAANMVFANAVASIGWGNLILVWFALMIVGVIVMLPYEKFKKV